MVPKNIANVLDGSVWSNFMSAFLYKQLSVQAMSKICQWEIKSISWPNTKSKSKQLLKYEPSDWLKLFHIPGVYPIDVAPSTHISILSHAHFPLCNIQY